MGVGRAGNTGCASPVPKQKSEKTLVSPVFSFQEAPRAQLAAVLPHLARWQAVGDVGEAKQAHLKQNWKDQSTLSRVDTLLF